MMGSIKEQCEGVEGDDGKCEGVKCEGVEGDEEVASALVHVLTKQLQ